MGVLYNVIQLQNQKQMEKQFVLERLKELGVTHSQQGQPIQQLSYKELLYELILAEMRQVDIDHPEHKWFR